MVYFRAEDGWARSVVSDAAWGTVRPRGSWPATAGAEAVEHHAATQNVSGNSSCVSPGLTARLRVWD